MKSAITIRPFSPTDLLADDQMLRVLETLTSVDTLSPKMRPSIAEMLSQHPYYVFVAEDTDGTIVGTTTLLVEQKIVHDGGLCGHLEDVAVLADQQGKGIGRELIAVAVAKAKELGCYKVILDCNDDTMSFYERCGFNKKENCMRIDL